MSRLSPATTPQYYPGQQQQEEPIVPRRLELSLDPTDGSLMTAPLLSVVMAATDGLYNDLYQMAHGQVEIGAGQQAGEEKEEGNDDGGGAGGTTTDSTAAGGGAADDPSQQPQQQTTHEKMSSLSFAQRRHELSWRMASHGKVLTQVAALTAAAANTDLSDVTQVSTRALQHARTAWVQADEAQDALYFFHAQLFPARQAPHDIYGAVDTLLGKAWNDLPQDLQLTIDRYEQSQEKVWPPREVADQWHMAVRDKLLLGEMGWMELNGIHVPWKISVRGGIVRLTHGQPKTTSLLSQDNNITTEGEESGRTTAKTVYPLEAVVTVLSTSQPAVWTLVSVDVHAQAKTGQSNHQVDASNRQRFDLHRLCALAMAREEARAHKEREQQQQQDTKSGEKEETNTIPANNFVNNSDTMTMARPLNALFQVAQIFELSWQLEILSAQAQALRQVWGTYNSSIVVTPVQFFENRSILGMVSISFWSVDDRNGPPCMGDLHLDEDGVDFIDPKNISETNKTKTMIESGDNAQLGEGLPPDTIQKSSSDSVSTVSRSINTPSVTNQLTLSIRAEPNVGVRVALSGAESVMEFASVQPHIKSTIRELLEATSNPFCLSASEALLAATRLCAERKCYAVVQALHEFLPPWIRLFAEKGAIAVACSIQYDGIVEEDKSSGKESDYIVLFRLTCDARTGNFAATFARCAKLLQYVACNNIRAASDSTALRVASLAQRGRGGGNKGGGGGFASGRAVRDAFDGLARSMNMLGQRTAVGGAWKDNNDMSASLRVRAVSMACKDVRVSLVTCCGMAAQYGLSAVAIGVATGVAPTPDM